MEDYINEPEQVAARDYIAPRIEVIELENEGAVMACSVPNMPGEPLWW